VVREEEETKKKQQEKSSKYLEANHALWK